MENKKQTIEIADIFRDYKHDLADNLTLCAVQQKRLMILYLVGHPSWVDILYIATTVIIRFNHTTRAVIVIVPNVSI